MPLVRRTCLVSVLLLMAALMLGVSGLGRSASTYDPAADRDSMYNLTAQTGVTSWWNAGYTAPASTWP